jgi:type I restriction enzyme S subunit
MTLARAAWPVSTFRDLGTWYGGGTPSKANGEFWTGGSIPWLSPKDMGPDVVSGTQDFITEDAVMRSAVKLVPAGSVAVVVRSGILERTLPVGYLPFDTTLNQDLKAVVPRPDIDAKWIAWGFRSREQQLLRDCRKAGTTVASIEMPRFLQESLPIPPIDEQRRIVEILEDHLSRLDAARGYLERARRQSFSAVASLIARATSRGEFVALSSIAVSAGYGTSTKCVADGPGVPVVRIPNLVAGRINLHDEKRVADTRVDVTSMLLSPGDLLIVRTNGSRDLIGRCAVVQEGIEAAFASYLIRYRLDITRVLPEWVRLVMNSPALRVQLEALAASSAGQYNLSLGKLDKLPIRVPPIEEQRRVVEDVSEAVASFRRLDGGIDEADRRGSVLRRALLQAAFSGRLTGSSTDTEIIEELVSV